MAGAEIAPYRLIRLASTKRNSTRTLLEVEDSVKQSQSAKTLTTSPRATYQDVMDAPPQMVAEIVDGTLYTNRRPAPIYTFASSYFGPIIHSSFGYRYSNPGEWWIIREPEIHLGEDIVVPNWTGFRLERMPEIPMTDYLTMAPDWACEILSPATRKLDLVGKRPIYAREGVRHLWLVDPDAKSLEAFELRGTEWVSIDKRFDEESVSLPPFDAISFNLGYLWPTSSVYKIPSDSPTVESEPELTEPSS